MSKEIDDIFEYYEYDDELFHYGTKRHSGRYPWGSGKEPFQRSGDFLSRIDDLKKRGLNEKEIAETLGLSTTRLRAQESLAKEERRGHLISRIRSLQADGLNNVQIAAKLGLKGESSVRSLLNADSEARMNIAIKTAENLKSIVDEKGMIDKVLTTNLIYQTPELLERPYYINCDMSKYIAYIIDTLNHDTSISDLLNPSEKIHTLVTKYRNGEVI